MAGDVDEAREQAETLLKEMSLSGYYDEVALKGLRLAAIDAQRGVLHGEQLLEVRNAVRDLVQVFVAYEDQAPSAADNRNGHLGPPEPDAKPMLKGTRTARLQADPDDAIDESWRLDSAVLCLAGRGPLDEAAGTMLVQLLRKHGVGARLLPHEAVSRHQIGSLGVGEVTMICIFYLELRGRPAHLRYLLERLLSRLPKVPVLVGLWASDDAFMNDPARQKDLGVTYCVTTLQEAVDVCLREAAPRITAADGSPNVTAASHTP